MLESSFKESLDPSYLKIFTKFEDVLKATKDDKGKRMDLIVQFSSIYMMPKELWDEYFELTHKTPHALEERERTTIMVLPSVYHFFYKYPIGARDHFGPIRLPKRKLLRWKVAAISTFDLGIGISSNSETLINDISFPNENIERKWRQYEKSSSSMPPQKVVKLYQKMKALFAKIEAIDKNDDEKWIKTLLEVEDNEFVEHNIEYRIGTNLTNKKLWKLYIQYLKDQQQNSYRLLHTYSKYCRFFLDDVEMKEEYRQAAKDYGSPVEVPWKNPFDFEIFGENVLKNYFFKNDNLSYNYYEEEENNKVTVYFNTDNLIKQQNFPFKTPFIHYIIQNANARVLQNLFKCCKWFFVKNPIPLCYSLVTKQRPMEKPQINFYQQSVEVVKIALNETGIENIYLSTALKIMSLRDRMMLSKFIPKMFKCDAKYISIVNQNLTFKELQFLIGHGNVVDLSLSEVHIIDGDNKKEVVIEDIIKLIPKAQFIDIAGIASTPKTAQILSQLKFENKMESFNLKMENLEPNDFVEFIKKNLAPKSRIFIHFKFNHNVDNIFNFREIVENAINTHWKESEKPMIKVI
uniref:Uncharacterized protein n=1 Tax=Panagrolaimus superbus TaxID=310955 RepID=A0A914YMK4_9BILA